LTIKLLDPVSFQDHFYADCYRDMAKTIFKIQNRRFIVIGKQKRRSFSPSSFNCCVLSFFTLIPNYFLCPSSQTQPAREAKQLQTQLPTSFLYTAFTSNFYLHLSVEDVIASSLLKATHVFTHYGAASPFGTFKRSCRISPETLTRRNSQHTSLRDKVTTFYSNNHRSA